MTLTSPRELSRPWHALPVEDAAGALDTSAAIGISADEADTLFRRGKRADESVPGQGIGLAVVRETVELYRGTLAVEKSELGGAELRVELARAGLL